MMIGITLGDCVELCIDEDDYLFIRKTNGTSEINRIGLGKATIERFEALENYLARLKIHAVTVKGLT